MAFIDKICPAPVNGGFHMDGYWVWCGSAIRGEDGKYHLFASRWPKSFSFFNGYLAYSEIVRAVSDSPLGPYTFAEVVLSARGETFWDGRMTHNPTISLINGIYALFYIGSTYAGPCPCVGELDDETRQSQFWKTRTPFAIGLATASSITGPWARRNLPVLERREGKWDQTVATNPAVCHADGGKVLLYYRSNTPEGLRIGLAAADGLDQPFERVCDDPVITFEGGGFIEDPFVWREGGSYQMIAKDMTGSITGEVHAGIHAYSDDGMAWRVANPPKAYSRRITWDNGTETVQGCLERPQLLFENGKPSYLFAATGDGPGGFHNCQNTWTQAFALSD